MRKPTTADIGKDVYLPKPLSGRYLVPLLGISEDKDGQPVYLVQDTNIRVNLTHSREVLVIEDFDDPTTLKMGRFEGRKPEELSQDEQLQRALAINAARQLENDRFNFRRPDPVKKKDKPFENTCLCGCGNNTRGTFFPGHDAKVKSLLVKFGKGEVSRDKLPEAVVEYVKTNEKWRVWFGGYFSLEWSNA